MDKTVALLYDARDRPRDELRRTLLDACAPRILEGGALRLSLCIADEHAAVRSPSPFPLFGRRISGLLNVWSEAGAPVDPLLAPLRAAGFEVHAYDVEESVYTDYGDNAHAKPRDWPDGQRSPGITAVTLMRRPRRLDPDEWVRRWHGRMSPVSERIQPRTRYVRNRVRAPLAPGAPPFAGIVEEAWPSARHVSNPFLFYGARNTRELVVNAAAIVAAVCSFLTLWRVETVMMSEYFVRTGFAPDVA